MSVFFKSIATLFLQKIGFKAGAKNLAQSCSVAIVFFVRQTCSLTYKSGFYLALPSQRPKKISGTK